MNVAEYQQQRVKIASGSSHFAFEQACAVVLIAFVGVYYHAWILSSWVTQAVYAAAIIASWVLITWYQNWSKKRDLELSDKHHRFDASSGDFQK